MKTKKQLTKYFKKNADAAEALIKKPDNQFTVEDFHQLRVAIKKIRALAAMLESSVNKFNSDKVIKPIKKIFDQAGKVREIQLEESTLRKHNPGGKLKLFSKTLHLKEQEEKINFTVIHNQLKDELKKAGGSIIQAIKKAHKSSIKKYLKQTKKEINDLVSRKVLEIKQVHELRKGLKKLYYNMKSLKLTDNSKAFKNGDALQELMGQWHDSRIINRNLLEATGKRITAPSETAAILKIANQLDAKSQLLYKKINMNKKQKIF